MLRRPFGIVTGAQKRSYAKPTAALAPSLTSAELLLALLATYFRMSTARDMLGVDAVIECGKVSWAPWLLHLHPACCRCFPLLNGPISLQALAFSPQLTNAQMLVPSLQPSLL